MRTSIIVIALFSIFVSARSVSLEKTIHQDWELFKVTYNKSYRTDDEELKRLQIYLDNKEFVTKHNKLYEEGKVTYSVAVNQFADWTDKEIEESLLNCFRYPRADEFRLNYSTTEEEGYDGDDVDNDNDDSKTSEEEVNWVKKGAVTSVKNQGHCGSCYIFSAIGALEGQYFLKTGKLIDLSVQDVLDCIPKIGCRGGNPVQVFDYVKSSNGVDTWKDYPYRGRKEKCRFDPRKAIADCTGYERGDEGCEECLRKMVEKKGPVSVGMYAKEPGFMRYKSGVYQSSNCPRNDLDHALLVVGYGTDAETGLDYWLLKNSWGTHWGEEGYVRIARNMDNMCGIADDVTIPTL